MDESAIALLEKLMVRIHELEQENNRLRLALALKEWKPLKGKRGRHKKNTESSEEELAIAVIKLGEHFGFKKRGLIPTLCRLLNNKKPLSERLKRVELEAQIHTLQNRLGPLLREKNQKP